MGIGCSRSLLVSRSKREHLVRSRRQSLARRSSTREDLPDAAPFPCGERVMLVQDSGLVDATVVKHHGDGTYSVAIDGGHKDRRELLPVNSCVQRFENVLAYRRACASYAQHIKDANAYVEDGITGKRLQIEKQMQYISTENEAAASSARGRIGTGALPPRANMCSPLPLCSFGRHRRSLCAPPPFHSTHVTT